jgi:hypothetical protein
MDENSRLIQLAVDHAEESLAEHRAQRQTLLRMLDRLDELEGGAGA